MAQSVERRIGSAEVTGPIPVSSSFFESAGALIFQGVRLFLIPLLYYFSGVELGRANILHINQQVLFPYRSHSAKFPHD